MNHHCAAANEAQNNKIDRETLCQQEKENKQLKAHLWRKDKALGVAAALLVLKKSPGDLGGGRRRLIDIAQRRIITWLVDNACEQGARLSEVCRTLGFSARTIQHWRMILGRADGSGHAAKQRAPANKLSER